MLDGEVTDVVEAHSLSLNNQHIHIYSASWGPEDDGKSLDGPAKLAKEAFLNGVTKVSQNKILMCESSIWPVSYFYYLCQSRSQFDKGFNIFLPSPRR